MRKGRFYVSKKRGPRSSMSSPSLQLLMADGIDSSAKPMRLFSAQSTPGPCRQSFIPSNAGFIDGTDVEQREQR
ncbi:hypothetical protein NEUTE2DRAFT_82416, partial [Neurospora tetrasperma FGSC 2509]